MDEPQLLTVDEVATILRVVRTTVLRYIDQGSLQVISLGGRSKSAKRIKRTELERFLAISDGGVP